MFYILSQIFVLLAYAFLGLTYLIKNKKWILFLSTMSTVSFTVSYVFLSAWTGFAVNIVALVRNLIFYLIARFAPNSKFWNYFSLIFTFVLIAICSVITYNGVLSLMAVAATIAYTYAIWNKKGNNYKIFGIVSSLMWIIYNAFIRSILGVVFEFIMVICAIVGLIKNRNKEQEGEKI